MSEQDYNRADEEVLGVVHGAFTPCGKAYLVSEEDAMRLVAYDNAAAEAEQMQELNEWKNRVLMVAGAVVRACVGFIFIGGMMDGLMDPVFAMGTAATCVVWGAGYLWGRMHHA